MLFLLLAVGLFVAGGLAALMMRESASWSTLFGAGGTILGSVIGLIPTLQVLFGGSELSLQMPWAVPYGSFFIAIDALSAFFLLPVFLLSALAAVYGSEYLFAYRGKKSLGLPWFFFTLLTASM